MTPEQLATASKPTVLALGEAYSRCPTTLRRARLLGISGWAFYVAGRAGALGDVRAETAAATLGFIAPDAVADGWDAALRVVRPSEVAAASLAECCRWGDDRLTALPQVDRLAALLERAVTAADASGMPLFAAWRAMPSPARTPGARVAAGLRLLREHFTGAHLLAVRASGMTPLEAVLAGPEGESGAMACGWPPPYPPVGSLVRRRLWAEAVTDRLVAPAFATLGPADDTELLELLAAARTYTQGLRALPARATKPSGS
ncbi:SCO6745 family protein [Micromonospora sp. CA-263727]|uniref:SCO6745 family protein n=1 Tax=Micromonospora sp. CA-263727 TaxID=3239967 RepID=UPI003D8CBB93